MQNVFVDTELWIYSLKKPDANKYPDKELHEQDKRKHLRAQAFFKKFTGDTQFFFTTHQICEIYHALRFRGTRLDPTFVRSYIDALVSAKSNHVFEATKDDVKRSIDLSITSNIHVWDFLCVIPIINRIDTIYTSDKHFTHQAMQDLGIAIENPIGTWDEL
jgi:predicted nucleic acid-binding protein